MEAQRLAARSETGGKSRDPGPDDARERTLRTAYELFRRHGVNAVGIDRIIAEAGVAKMSLYRHFGSKDELVIAVLQRRGEVWTRDWLQREVERLSPTPAGRLLAIFDAFEAWFGRPDYDGCLMANCLLESRDRTSPIGSESVRQLAEVGDWLRGLAEGAGVSDPASVAGEWQILMLGSIMATAAGMPDAAARAREAAKLILEREGVAP